MKRQTIKTILNIIFAVLLGGLCGFLLPHLARIPRIIIIIVALTVINMIMEYFLPDKTK